MILLDSVSKVYGDKTVVNKLSMEIKDGELCVLIGPSGCGKTTTLKMINRLIEPTSGVIIVNGKNVSSFKPEKLRRQMGYAIQMVGLFPHMSVAANIAVVPELLKWDKNKIKKRIVQLLELVGLNPSEYESKYPHELSGGEAQRIGVARALAANPPILLMDEPFGAVDPLTREKLQAQFLNIQKELKKTIILVTHDLDEAIRLADRIAITNNGELVQFDSPEAILANPSTKFVYSFVGTDRALKRLSRISAAGFIKPADKIGIGDTVKNAYKVCRDCRWVWVVGEDQKLTGWIDMTMLASSDSVIDAMVKTKPNEISITDNSTLKEALSIMLSQGIRTVPVIDKNTKLLGQLDMDDIENAISNEEKST